MQTFKHIGFIGGGNMASALIGGLVASGTPGHSVICHDPDSDRLQSLAKDFGVQIVNNNQAVIDHSDVVVLAVKPQALRQALDGLKIRAERPPLFLTIAAGIRTRTLQQWLGGNYAMVRAMPNTPALVRAGATGIFATTNTTAEQRQAAESVLRAVGVTLWLENEDLLDAVTALSGSGPAYFFYFMEAMEKAGIALGLPAETARLLTIETAFGSAKLALEVKEDPRTLRQRVTSPGGTTERAIGVFDTQQLADIIGKALTAARDRAAELAGQLEK